MHTRRNIGGLPISTRSAKIWALIGLLLLVVVAAVWILLRVSGVQNSTLTSSKRSSVEAEVGTYQILQLEETKKTADEAASVVFELGPIEDFWELCVPQEFPEDLDAAWSFGLQLELSKECQEGFETYMFTLNPFLWRGSRSGAKFSFLVLDEPMNFERVFGDPAGDLERIVEALARPECRLEDGVVVNWELKETCHADAFLNYAEFHYFCHDNNVNIFWDSFPSFKDLTNSQRYKLEWQTLQEMNWLKDQCDEVRNSVPELGSESYPEEFAWLQALWDQRSEFVKQEDSGGFGTNSYLAVIDTLRELAARLGDESAALLDTGQFFGSFISVLASDPWKQINSKESLSKERLQSAIDLVIYLEQENIDFNWEWLVEHLCSNDKDDADSQELSCRAVINELYIEDMVSGPILEVVSKFEQVAIELGVYE